MKESIKENQKSVNPTNFESEASIIITSDNKKNFDKVEIINSIVGILFLLIWGFIIYAAKNGFL